MRPRAVGPGGRDEHGLVESLSISHDEADYFGGGDHYWLVTLTYQTEVIEHEQGVA